MDEELRASENRNLIESEKDDEKITVKKFLYSSLRDTYMEVEKSKSPRLKGNRGGSISRIMGKMDDLRKTYKIVEEPSKNDEASE